MPDRPLRAPSMQEAILALTSYWASRGAAVMQPYNTEVGAGTLNPATFLRVLGPEPWRVGYVEPSVRPDDSRYGENPNRLQTHTQYQVILKPDPGNSQDLYLGSLAAIGIDLDAHDVRFVEDNWASPALGAWGLGWEVWLDGLEITQFTYFQQAGGFSLDPVSVEITYGLERILMALQDVTHFKQIEYSPGVSYGDIFGQSEYEWSRYYLDEADIDVVSGLFETYEREAIRLIEQRLPVPAYSYVLKCSQTFNILDSRGAVSPTERARSFGRMRRLAHQVAELWAERREEEGYPLGRADTGKADSDKADSSKARSKAPARGAGEEESALSHTSTSPATLAFEIGVEEIPAADVTAAAERLERALTEGLAGTRLEHGKVAAAATPRRIVGLVESVAAAEESRDEVVRGPRRSVAFDDKGHPTKAGEGFARSQGVDAKDLTVVEVKGVEHVAAHRHVRGRVATDVLGEVLAKVVADLRSPDKNMKWNAPGLSFARPIRWVLALLGSQVVEFEVANLRSGRTTQVLRTDKKPARSVADADSFLDVLAAAGIEPDISVRREVTAKQVTSLAEDVTQTTGEKAAAHLESDLLDEVTNLVESPNAILGRFDPAYLELPSEILVTVMRKHQRYFPVRNAAGDLLPAFVTVANGPCDAGRVRAGNESVLRARYEDARFFWKEDLEKKPEHFYGRLSRLVFADKLGSMGERAERIGVVAKDLASRGEARATRASSSTASLDSSGKATLDRAAKLVKFDLATQMVTELTSLAGVMAREYARRAGETEEVAQALFEQELPRHSSDVLPETNAGSLLSVANRADLLAGLFATGAEPTGSSDPFAMRRAALGLLAVLEAHPLSLDVAEVLDVAGAHQPVHWDAKIRDRAVEFVARRWETQQLENGRPADPVRAVLRRFGRPREAEEALAWLCEHQHDEEFLRVAQALGRAARIVKEDTPAGWDKHSHAEPAEADLRRAVQRFEEVIGKHGGASPAPAPASARSAGSSPASLQAFVAAAADLVGPIDRFFEDVLVMAKDEKVKANRLGLLATIRDLSQSVIDWTALS